MADILIRGMEMPKSCGFCKLRFFDGDADCCPFVGDACGYGTRHVDCPLVELPHWISVEERLPEKDEMVIVYYSWIGQSGTEHKEVSLATLEEMRYCGNKLLGWMPLSEPPKEVE